MKKASRQAATAVWLSALLVGAFLSLALAMSVEASDTQTVVLEWQAPTQRVNGDALEPDEIGGYELRYGSGGDTSTVLIPDGTAVGYELELSPGDYDFEIAAYDTNGLYSDFVPLSGRAVSRPGEPVGFIFKREAYSPSPSERCEVDPQCLIDVLSARFSAEED